MHKLLTGPLKVERLQVSITELPAHLQGLRLVQLSDFHFDGVGLSPALLDEAIAASNSAHPNLILLTGDFITDNPAPIHGLAQRLSALSSQSGTYAVLGNHDIRYRHSRSHVTKALTDNGIQVLWNEIAYPFGADLPLVGLADFWSPEFNPAPVMERLDPNIPRLLLSHNPDTAERLQHWRVDLQLSGHTHGGQVCLPGVGNMAHFISALYWRLPNRLRRRATLLKECARTMKHWEWAQGLHRVGNNQLYVNRGLGTYMPGRLFCRPEVTVITLI